MFWSADFKRLPCICAMCRLILRLQGAYARFLSENARFIGGQARGRVLEPACAAFQGEKRREFLVRKLSE